ncbi:MAG: PsbP-related protein [Candidatus Curtissbacteria bacterium]
MKSAQTGNILIFLLIGVALVLGIVFLLQKKPILTPKTESTSSSSVKVDDLKSYTSEKLKLSFSYPKNWIISELSDRSIVVADKELSLDPNAKMNDKQIKITITTSPTLAGQSFETSLKYLDEREKGKNNIVSEDKIDIGNKRGIRRMVQPLVGSDLNKYILIFIQNNNSLYSLSATPADSSLMPVFDQMLQTFKFN